MKKIWMFLLAAGVVLTLQADEIELKSDAWTLRKGWTAIEDGVQVNGNRYDQFLTLKTPTTYSSGTFTAEVKILEKNAPEGAWKICGLLLMRDKKNFIQLALVEPPNESGRKGFIEFGQMKDGKWGSDAGIVKGKVRDSFQWQTGVEYKLRIKLAPESVTGEVLDDQGKVLTTLSMNFTSDDAIKSGAPAFRCAWVKADLTDAEMENAQ